MYKRQGVRAALRAIPILREAGVSSRVVNLKPHKDPDEFIKALGAEEFEKRLEQAMDCLLYTSCDVTVFWTGFFLTYSLLE